MIELLTDRDDSDRAFRRWVDTLIGGSKPNDAGWVVEGTGVTFSNYGHGEPGTVTNQIMLGVDSNLGSGIVKIVQPDTSQQDKGKLTVIGRDETGRTLLLREGWLRKNAISEVIREHFAALTGLSPVSVSASGRRSDRDWYVVADLDAPAGEVLESTVAFTHACSQARAKAGGGRTEELSIAETYRLGLTRRVG